MMLVEGPNPMEIVRLNPQQDNNVVGGGGGLKPQDLDAHHW